MKAPDLIEAFLTMSKTFSELNNQKRILAALFDVKPVTRTGDLDIEKIEQVETVLNLREVKTEQEGQQRAKAIKIKIEKPEKDVFLSDYRAGVAEDYSLLEELPTKEEILADLKKIDTLDNLLEVSGSVPESSEECYFPEVASQELSLQEEEPVISPQKAWLKLPIFSWKLKNKSLTGFLIAGLLISLVIPAAAWVGHGLTIKEEVLSNSLSAYQNLLAAQESLQEADWQVAEESFNLAHLDFSQAHQEIKKLGQLTLGILDGLPGTSLVSSGSHLVKVGEALAQAGHS